MDPEDFLPIGLIVLAVLGAVGRRVRTNGQADPATLGRSVGSAGGTLSRASASVLRSGGHLGVDLTSGAMRAAGTVASALGGVVIDGAVLTVGALTRPVLRGAGHTLTGAADLLFPRNGAAEEDPAPGPEAGATEVWATPRGKRFHRQTCPMRPAGGLRMERETAVETGRQPCPTCRA